MCNTEASVIVLAAPGWRSVFGRKSRCSILPMWWEKTCKDMEHPMECARAGRRSRQTGVGGTLTASHGTSNTHEAVALPHLILNRRGTSVSQSGVPWYLGHQPLPSISHSVRTCVTGLSTAIDTSWTGRQSEGKDLESDLLSGTPDRSSHWVFISLIDPLCILLLRVLGIAALADGGPSSAGGKTCRSVCSIDSNGTNAPWSPLCPRV